LEWTRPPVESDEIRHRPQDGHEHVDLVIEDAVIDGPLVAARRERGDDDRERRDLGPISEVDVAVPLAELHNPAQQAFDVHLGGVWLDRRFAGSSAIPSGLEQVKHRLQQRAPLEQLAVTDRVGRLPLPQFLVGDEFAAECAGGVRD
jgi:hypothetical protein